MVAVPVSIIIGSPLSGWLMSVPLTHHLSGWRWMLLLEGAPTALLSVLLLRLIPDNPAHARWLTPAQTAWLEGQLAVQVAKPAQAGASRIRREVLANGRVWVIAACWFAIMSGTCVGMVLNAWHSDRTQERYLHVGTAAVLAGASTAIAAVLASGGLALAFPCVAGLAFGAAQSPFWTYTRASFVQKRSRRVSQSSIYWAISPGSSVQY
jgi:MFS transporter, ACS family, tartrate transporter